MHTLHLTAQQKRLWIEWKLNPKGHYYNINVQFRLVGALDIARFRAALREATGYFEAFRTYFSEQEGTPWQNILPEAADILDIVDFSELAEGVAPEREQEALQHLRAIAKAPIDLTHYPLMRATLIKVAPDIHYFILITPHILSDGQSGRMILEAITAVYNGDAAVMEKFQRHATHSVAEYLAATRQNGMDGAEYWQHVLRDAPLHLPFSGARSKMPEGKRFYFDLDPAVTLSVKALARKEKTTLFNVLAGAYGLLLSRYFGTSDLVVTYPVNIRGTAFSQAFGFYINNIPLRMRLAADISFSDLLQHITEQRRHDREHEYCATDEIIRHLRKQAVALPEVPFNVSFGQTSFSLHYLQLEGISVEALRCDPSEVLSDLSLQYDSTAKALGFYWEYKTDLFHEEQVRDLSESFLNLLQQASTSPNMALHAIPALSETQQKRILQRVSAAETAESEMKCYDYPLIAAIAQHAMQQPQAIALKTVSGELTYRQLEEKTNQLAHHLHDLGVRHNQHVVVCLERSEAMVVALIAVLKAGAAYVPIDPHYPRERIQEIIADCVPAIALHSACVQQKFIGLHVPSCCIDDEATQATIAACSVEAPCVAFDAQDTAYIIYTSGSTGTPKGVVVSHANVNARLEWLQRTIPLGTEDRALQTINYCFDPSVFEIFWPLRAGATLVLAKPNINQDPRAIIEAIDRERITFFSTIPSLLRLWLQKLKAGECATLRHALCGGEVLPRALANDFLRRTKAQLYNAYGPTEATILASCHVCSMEESADTLPIGRPLGDTAIYIMAPDGALQPWGAVGEICIGGAGIAKGYLNRPSLTAEKFITDPFSVESGTRLYRTGDLGRYLPDGQLAFIGRADTQLKLRGFRVEPGEIEHALTQIQDVAQAVVIAQATSSGHRLIGYYSPATLPAEEVRTQLSAWLPEHMVPSLLVPMAEMPVTAHGKIDRAALPEPHTLQFTTKAVREFTATEAQLRDCFAEILECEPGQIGPEDKFFDIGGDSLQAIELALRINQRLALNVSDTVLFEHPSVAALARFIGKHQVKKPTVSRLDERIVQRQQVRDARRKLQRAG